MKTRAQQREDTRERIVEAARSAFADLGFQGASTREIAARAGTTQGLITYHFRNKEELWKVAVGGIFELMRSRLAARFGALDTTDHRAFAREVVREFVRFAAEHPELFQLMMDQGKQNDRRMRWLVDTHLKPMYDAFLGVGTWSEMGYEERFKPHAYYLLAGAASVIFAVAPECKRLTGLDPTKREAIEAHAEYLAQVMVP